MKNILKTSLMAFLLIASAACSNDDDENTVPTANGGPTLLAPEDGREFVLSPADQDDILTTFIWEHSNFGVGTSASYALEVAKGGTNFATPIQVGASVSDRFITITVKELNDALATSTDFSPFVENEVQVRIKATLGTSNEMMQYSNVLTLLITPYSDALPLIGVPGAHQNPQWTPSGADLPLMASEGYGNTKYEGYMYLNGEFKFLSPKPDGTFDWGTPDWGDNGDFAGVLQAGSPTNATAPAGYYRVEANTGELTYKTTLTNWGIIGSATPGLWDNSTALTYNATSKKWEGIVALTAGEFKFRANNEWVIDLGGFDPTKPGAGEEMSYGGLNIVNSAPGNYKVELDLSNPRAYSYTLTPQ